MGLGSGVMACPTELVSEDGYDLQFATNVIGTSPVGVLTNVQLVS